jgi:hypothetical protein
MQSTFITNEIFEVLLPAFACYYLLSNNRKGGAAAKLRVDLKGILK